MEEMKHCKKCDTTKVLTEFYNDKKSSDGKSFYCKQCLKARASAWYKSNPERAKEQSKKRVANGGHRSSQIKRKYNFTQEQYDDMLIKQNGVCLICGTDTPGRNDKNFHIDHDHDTDRVRGLLCSNCNRAIGLLGDLSVNAYAAGDYLKSHNK